MDLSNLGPHPKNSKQRKRIGRGHSAGQGKTSGRGMKGQHARNTVRPGFEGGQNPLFMRLPMRRGLSNKSHNIGIFRKYVAIINVSQLEHFDVGTEVTPELLFDLGIVKQMDDGLKVLGEGEITKALTVKAHAFSASAVEKIQAAGGTVEVIEA